MSDYQKLAANLLEQTGAANPERAIQKATVWAYMARTEALKPEPIVRNPDKVWIILQRSGGGDWKIMQVFLDEQPARAEYANLSVLASGTNNYWEVDVMEIPVSS